ncbi:MAG TPA: hypothetical protein PKB06_10115, partial [Actinotalea sp.]|nr:hypothetical protein [Actinotalea sp.]
MAWLTGNITSGILVFGDVRDIVAATLEGRWIDTAIIGVGFIPAYGDFVELIGKFAKALPRMAEPAAAAARHWLIRLLADDTGSIGPRHID